ncbi:MAG: hypothetical protein VYC34_08765, partial [Planctomycetota bacterium]|nr:hypothetical protein [Planctomycetota bacterium]
EALEAAMVAAVNGVGALGVTAVADTMGSLVVLVNDNPGAAGNVAIAETVANANFLAIGMMGGDSGAMTNGAVGEQYAINTDDPAPPGAPPNPAAINAAATLALLNQADMYGAAYRRAMSIAGGIDGNDNNLGFDRNYTVAESVMSGATDLDGPLGDGRVWAIMVLGVYDPGFDQDNDPNTEGSLFGVAPPMALAGAGLMAGQGVAVVYQESSRDTNPGNPDLAATAAHEITHNFGCRHASGNTGAAVVDPGDPMGSGPNPETDDDIMTTDFPVPAGKQLLNDKHLNEIRTRIAPNATPFTSNPS